MSGTGVEFDSTAAQRSAARLDALADRLESELRESTLFAPPAGQDAVSHHAARSLHSVASSYRHSATAGIHEIRGLAAALRTHSHRVGHAEADSAAAMGAIR